MRTRQITMLVVAFICLGTLGCQGMGKLDWTHLGRESWQRPDDLIDALAIEPGDRVADIGAGHGYFLSRLSRAVGSDGMVYAVDVDAQLIDDLKASSPEANVEVILGTFDDPMLPDGAVDLVLLVNTFHHIEDRPAYFARLRADLSARGRVAVVDPDEELGGVLSLFLDEGHTSTARDVTEDMLAAGYRKHASHDFLPIQIFEVFELDPNAD